MLPVYFFLQGHICKNVDTLISQGVRKIHSENRIILTGTPLANNLVELWSLLNFLLPNEFTTSDPFADAFDLTLQKVDDQKLMEAHRVLDVLMLRRMKTAPPTIQATTPTLSSTARPNTPKAIVPIMKEAPDSVSLCAAEYRLYRMQANPFRSTA